LAGQVVGINTLVVRGDGSGSAMAEGLGFAVPSNVAQAVADRLIRFGFIARPSLGIRWGWITPEIARRFDLPVEYGVYLSEVIPGGPADQASLENGDIIVSIDGQQLDQQHPFINTLFEHEPGESIWLTVMRGSRSMEVEVTLEES
jgi:2-alkenal reductase